MGPFLGGELGDDHEPGSRAVVLQGQHHKQTRPRLDYQNQAVEVMLSTRGRSPRVDELPPSSAPDTSPRRRDPFMASLSITPARGSKNAAGAAGAHKAAAHPARRRGEERPHLRRRGDGVEALLRHRASLAGSPSRRFAVQTLCIVLVCQYASSGQVTGLVRHGYWDGTYFLPRPPLVGLRRDDHGRLPHRGAGPRFARRHRQPVFDAWMTTSTPCG